MTFPVGVNVGNVSGFISGFQAEGLGPTAALRAFREAGGAIRDARWFNAWGEVAASKVGQVDVGAHPVDVVPSADMYSQWHAGKPGQYATQVRVLVRERGADTYSIRQYTHVTDRPHTGQEAIDKAIGTYSESAETYEEEVSSGFISGYYKMFGVEE